MARAGSLGVSFQSERYRDQSRGGVKVGINLGAVQSAGERRSGGATVSEALRIANCSGFYGDRFSAAREMLEGGPIDVLTGEYLAELTMLIRWKARVKDPDAGHATTILRQTEDVAGLATDRGVKIIASAGRANPDVLRI